MSVKAVRKLSSKKSDKVIVILTEKEDELLLQELEQTRKTFKDVSNQLSKSLETCVFVAGH
jgi:anion-transporting  ArsA/GET3 family ATPase